MKRRSLVALVAAGVLVFFGIAAVSAVLFVTRTFRGREWVRSIAQPLIARSLKSGGTLYLGHLSGSFLSDLSVDSVAIRDSRGDLFASSGPIHAEYNIRDLIDYRIFVRRVTVEHPYLHLVEQNDFAWNFRRLFSSPP